MKTGNGAVNRRSGVGRRRPMEVESGIRHIRVQTPDMRGVGVIGGGFPGGRLGNQYSLIHVEHDDQAAKQDRADDRTLQIR